MEIWDEKIEKQLTELMTQIALYRIRAYKGDGLQGLDENQLTDPITLEAEGYYKWCEREYFDEGWPYYVGSEDYQRLMLRNDGEYGDEDLESFCKLRCTLEGDKQYVQFWEKLSSETRWIEKAFRCSRPVWEKLECLLYYQAVKIAADLPKIYSTLIFSGFREYICRAQHDAIFYQAYAWLYFEIWKRVAKKEMNLKEALRQVSLSEMCLLDALLMIPGIPGPVTYNYERYVAHFSGDLEESDVRPLFMDAVKTFVRRPKIYYNFAKKKLDIAEKLCL
ncbi:hypothetical protein EJB05_24936, partial [Eragrostis curvula]